MADESVQLTRDCEAIQIPAGTKVTLTAGTPVVITQELGGNYTIMAPGMLARIDAKDADAIGKTPAVAPTSEKTASGEFDEQLVWEQMKKCFDPEIPVNIVDLGLIYDCQISPPQEGKRNVAVKMTLTAPGCGMGPVLVEDVKTKVAEVPGVGEINVELVWEPQWNQGMMSEAARLQLGLL